MARKRPVEEHENHERWLVSYADFITLLFAFFVILYATAEKNTEKEKKFEKSFRKYIQMVAVGGGGGQGVGAFDGQKESLIPTPIPTFPPLSAGAEEVRDYISRNLDDKMSKDEIEDTIVGLVSSDLGVRITLPAEKFFPSGSSALKLSAIRSLKKLGELLSESKHRILVEGHTDDLPIKGGRYPSNWELGAARASKIVRYFIKRHEIHPKRLTAISHADQKPLVKNNSPKNRAKNRRIELVIVTDRGLGI